MPLSTVTDEEGRFWFMDLPAGTYTVTEVLQDGWAQTWPPAGYYSFLLAPSQTIEGLNFGNRQPPTGSVHGAKWHDLNGDGSWDPNEPALPGWEIHIEGEGAVSFSAVTDELGRFWFMDLPAGTYTVKTWHEKLGELSREVTIGADPVNGVAFSYKRPTRKE